MRRFGILWRRLDYLIEHSILIATVCAKLHNVCVARWVRQGRPVNGLECDRQAQDHLDVMYRGSVFVQQDTQRDDFPTTSEVLERMGNPHETDGLRTRDSKKRDELARHIHSLGIRWSESAEHDFMHL